jgi:hypothetical protein
VAQHVLSGRTIGVADWGGGALHWRRASARRSLQRFIENSETTTPPEARNQLVQVACSAGSIQSTVASLLVGHTDCRRARHDAATRSV